MELAYYPGCSLKASSEIYDVQCKRVLSAIGINLHELDDWNCCGATSASKMDDFLAIAMPARNLGIADASGYSELVIPCSACYSRMLVAQKVWSPTGAFWTKSMGSCPTRSVGRTRILSILEAIQPSVDSGDLAKKGHQEARRPETRLLLRVHADTLSLWGAGAGQRGESAGHGDHPEDSGGKPFGLEL